MFAINQDALIEANKAETELEHKIQRKDAELKKSTNQEETSLQQLTVHKIQTKEERRKLEDEKRVRMSQQLDFRNCSSGRLSHTADHTLSLTNNRNQQ